MDIIEGNQGTCNSPEASDSQTQTKKNKITIKFKVLIIFMNLIKTIAIINVNGIKNKATQNLLKIILLNILV